MAKVVIGRGALGNNLAKVADDLAKVFAGGDHAPAADRVEPHRDRAVRQERRGVLRDDGVRVVDAQREIGFAVRGAFAVGALGLAGGKLVRAERVLRPEVARADAVTAPEDTRGFLRRNGRQVAAELDHFLTLAQRGADVPGQRVVAGHALVGALENNDVFLASQRLDDRRLGEGAYDVDVDRSHLGIALIAQIVAGGLDVLRRAAKRDEHRVGVAGLVLVQQPVTAAGELRELLAALLDEAKDRLVEIVAPGHHAVHVVLLVLHRAN